jgi:cytochrome b6-f complex iron-sulfur subunit
MTAEITDRDEPVTTPSRRNVFGMCSLGVLGAVGLAGCGSSDDTEPDTPSDDAAKAGSDAAETTPAAAAGPGTPLVKLVDVPVGGAVEVKVNGKPVIVSQPTKDTAVAFSAVCPHKFVTVVVSGKELLCPAHGSTFDPATGKNLKGPAKGVPLPTLPVEVVDGEVVQA